jgi:hypothetical protein
MKVTTGWNKSEGLIECRSCIAEQEMKIKTQVETAGTTKCGLSMIRILRLKR